MDFDLFHQPSYEPPLTGKELAEQGMNRATVHADEVVENWSERAYSLLIEYCGMKIDFMVEDFRAFCFNKNLPTPPSNRAFGSLIVRAKREGLVEFKEYRSVRNPKAHSTPASVWRVLNKAA